MLRRSLDELRAAGIDTTPLRELIRTELPSGTRAMSLPDGAAIGKEAFVSQQMLNHVIEEEIIHNLQKKTVTEFGVGTAKKLEEAVDVIRKFPAPK